ncbi:hypothetical protein O4G76_03240 [Limimaricola sp. G21655-S1]|uniref:hypothetical protein n=1 Tax=Limimaricola sp. G21655-S1 TaxID=3014768 RepID=UPI0022B05B0F|nr:hypothetical protein [Limimaricola sp. G21655-S1]MCZ4259857.1 hypothetical protein [Limimaricola sp. G21655-S1]
MKTLIGLGTALTIATAPMALNAEPKLKINGGGAVMQMLNAVVAGNTKQAIKAEKKLRKAARKAGVPVAAGTVAAASGGAAMAQAASAPAPRFAPESVGQRPRLRPEAASFAAMDTPAEAPPVTTLQNGRRIETSALGTSSTPGDTRVTSTTTAGAGPTVINIEGDRVSTSGGAYSEATSAPTLTAAAETATVEPAAQTVSLETDSSIFGGPTGY